MMISFIISNIMIEIKDKIWKSTRVMDGLDGRMGENTEHVIASEIYKC